MAGSIRPRASLENDVTTVKVLISHPMETGLRKDKATGKIIPAHFIQSVEISHNGKRLLSGLLGVAVSKNPFIQFSFHGGSIGDTISISWTDNKGESDSDETTIK